MSSNSSLVVINQVNVMGSIALPSVKEKRKLCDQLAAVRHYTYVQYVCILHECQEHYCNTS